ncbi:MAG TPA: efflux transporter outer membrane subunit [Gammaproteobacteria bacterium]|nr:efflux transporter outer membrane subunit [Gammaproteobacteria bacterium]
MRRINILLPLFSLLLSSCMVGPDYHSPDASVAKSQDIPAQWWVVFHSPEINNLVTAGLANSPTLVAANATLKEAQENLNAQIGSSLLPAINGQASGTRQRVTTSTTGQTTSPTIFNLYNATVNVSYTLDVFGGSRRQIEALRAQVNYQRFEFEAARLTLTSNIVTTAITIASLEEQIQATQQLIQSQKNQLNIVQKQVQLGSASGADVLTQDSELASTQATLPPLRQRLAQSQDALAVLVGQAPSDFKLLKLNLNELTLPAKLPTSLPSQLARQRPDIRAQEALLHAASAQVGVATANLYPQITLSGAYGGSGLSTANLFSPANIIWNYGGTFLQPIFHGGALLAQRRAAIDAFDQTCAQYRQVVLQGFQNVADTLQALQNDADAIKSQQLAARSAYDSLTMTQKQYKLGGVSYLNLLTAQRQYQTAKINLIQAKAAQFTDTAALFQALGGGWWQK